MHSFVQENAVSMAAKPMSKQYITQVRKYLFSIEKKRFTLGNTFGIL